MAYLTFDDGPSSVTENILNILRKKNVKATFFVTYHKDKGSVERLQRIVSEGHAVGLHSYSHRYKKIYANVESYFDDIDRLSSYIISNTGYSPKILRFPGGSNYHLLNKNLFYRIKSELNRRGYVYFDWNVSSGDASINASKLTVSDIVNNCYSSAKNYSTAVILMHDSSVKKKLIVDALPILIDKLTRIGFRFEVLSTETKQIVFRK